MIGCLLRLVLLPACMAVLYPLFLLRKPFPTVLFPAENAEVGAVVAGIFLWFAILCLMDIRRYGADRRALNKSFLQDQGRIIVSGAIEARGPLLKAPFSGKECVGYHYKAKHWIRGGSSTGNWCTDYEGCALVDSVVKTPHGDLSILANAKTEVFYEANFKKLEDAHQRAKDYLSGIETGETVNGPGDFRIDKIIGDRRDVETCDLEEKTIEAGETVLAAGVYSAEGKGIAPDPDDIMRPFHIVPGGEDALTRKIRSRLIGVAICTALCLSVFAVYFLVFLRK